MTVIRVLSHGNTVARVVPRAQQFVKLTCALWPRIRATLGVSTCILKDGASLSTRGGTVRSLDSVSSLVTASNIVG